MDDQLRAEAQRILDLLPRSIEMPAGTGKTQLVAAMAAEVADRGGRTLILTHTNTGVEAIRKRLKGRVDPQSFHLDTITGWAVDLARHYPVVAGVEVPSIVDSDDCDAYITGAIKVARTQAILRMHRVSFQYLLIDEYQDCERLQHDFVCALTRAIPRCAVLGDPLQGIFDFDDNVLINWHADVYPTFPSYPREHVPWRWQNQNEELGQWLLDIRPLMIAGGTIDLRAPVNGLTWQKSSVENEIRLAHQLARRGGTVVILHGQRNQHKTTARTVKGKYSIMEDLYGKFMHKELEKLERLETSQRAAWLAELAKNCFSNLRDVKPGDVNKLRNNQAVGHLKRPAVGQTMQILESVRVDSSHANLAEAMTIMATCGEGHCYAHEAWFDIARALRMAAIDNSKSTREHLSSIRSRIRYSGRLPRDRHFSRTVLVKGLEFDHVVIANAESIGDHKHLYVAMTRPRKSLTILSSSPILTLS